MYSIRWNLSFSGLSGIPSPKIPSRIGTRAIDRRKEHICDAGDINFDASVATRLDPGAIHVIGKSILWRILPSSICSRKEPQRRRHQYLPSRPTLIWNPHATNSNAPRTLMNKVSSVIIQGIFLGNKVVLWHQKSYGLEVYWSNESLGILNFNDERDRPGSKLQERKIQVFFFQS